MMNNPNKFQKPNDRREEEPFFSFEVPYGGLIVFEGGDPDAVERDIIQNYGNDTLIPLSRVSDPNDPYFAELQATRPPQYRNKNIQCIILPIRYTKVFTA